MNIERAAREPFHNRDCEDAGNGRRQLISAQEPALALQFSRLATICCHRLQTSHPAPRPKTAGAFAAVQRRAPIGPAPGACHAADGC